MRRRQKPKGFCANLCMVCCSFRLEEQGVLLNRYFARDRVHKPPTRMMRNSQIQGSFVQQGVASISHVVSSPGDNEGTGSKTRPPRAEPNDQPVNQFVNEESNFDFIAQQTAEGKPN